MANYECASRTNYFRVTDEERYKELFAGLSSEDKIDDFTHKDEEGVVWHGFGSYDSIGWSDGKEPEDPDDDDEDDDQDIVDFAYELQKILPDGEAFILFESGHEKLRYVTGTALIVTKDGTEFLDLRNKAVEIAREMLGDKKWCTKCEY